MHPVMAVSAAEPSSRLAVLRGATRDAHAAMEAVPAFIRLLADDLSIAEYVTILRHTHAFHATVEPLVAASLSAWPDAASLLDGSRAQALAEDLEWFGVSPIGWDWEVPALAGPDAALGALYVFEGSGLGGRVIARQVADSLGVAPGRGGSFYGGLTAEQARSRWQRLLPLLEVPTDEPDHALTGGAMAVFGCLERAMRRIRTAPVRVGRVGAAVAA